MSFHVRPLSQEKVIMRCQLHRRGGNCLLTFTPPACNKMSLKMRLQATFALRQEIFPSVPERIKTNIKGKCTRSQPGEDS